jgi:hypothetical protein
MKITKKKGENNYTISGLTLGKIEAIRGGLSRLKKIQEETGDWMITVVETELLRDLEFKFQDESVLDDRNMFA